MGGYKPTALTKLGHGPGHAKQHRVFAINENPESPDGSIEVGHYGDIYIPRSIYPSYGNPGGEVVDVATYFAEMFHHDMSGFQADFDPATGFMYPYVGSDEFHASFKPTDISGCVLWLGADAITGLNDNDPVGTWADQSGNGNDATQATAAKKPTYKTNIQNGLPAVRGDGTDDYLTTAVASNQPGTFFIVAACLENADGAKYLIDGDDVTNRWILAYDNTDVVNLYAGTVLGYGLVNPWGARLIECTVNGASSEILENGTSKNTGDASTKTIDGLKLFQSYQDGTGNASADIMEFLVYNVNVASSDRTSIRTYLNNKWALW